MVGCLFLYLLGIVIYGERTRSVLAQLLKAVEACWSLNAQEVLLLLFCLTFYFLFVCLNFSKNYQNNKDLCLADY